MLSRVWTSSSYRLVRNECVRYRWYGQYRLVWGQCMVLGSVDLSISVIDYNCTGYELVR